MGLVFDFQYHYFLRTNGFLDWGGPHYFLFVMTVFYDLPEVLVGLVDFLLDRVRHFRWIFWSARHL